MQCLSRLFCGLLFLFLGTEISLFGQYYYVYLADKPLVECPEDDFSAKSLQRRLDQGIDFPAYSDLPVSPVYVEQIRGIVDSVRFALRWPNAVTVKAHPDQIERLMELSFVREVTPMQAGFSAAGMGEVAMPLLPSPDSAKFVRLLKAQREMLQLDFIKSQGLTGKGVRIAIFDAGFKSADTHPAFAHLREGGKILKTRDFYGGDDKVYHHGDHGTAVLSCIAGMYGELNLGAATEAEFLLARTEHGLWEKIKEEDCWLAAMEWADQEGADLISSSLGYGKKRYVLKDLDGETAPVSLAAQTAAEKGILVINSAGNGGSGSFPYITAPGDAPTVLTVGSSYPMLNFAMPYTSHGPNGKGDAKPNVAGPGYVIAANKKGEYDYFSGTSFACPSVAGLAACVKQLEPKLKQDELHQLMMAIGHTHPYFDYRMGHGIPKVKSLFTQPRPQEPPFEVKLARDSVFVQFDQAVVNRDTAEQRNGKPCSIRWVRANGKLAGYNSFLIKSGQALRFPISLYASEIKDRGKLEIWFEGHHWREK